MVRRSLLPAIAASLLIAGALLVAGCGSGNGSITAKGDPVPVGAGNTTTPRDTSAESPDTTADPNLPPGTLDPETAKTCEELAQKYTDFATDGADGKLDGTEAAKRLEELKPLLPESLHDDLTTVADAFRALNEKGLFEGAATIASQKTRDALSALTDYVATTCAGSGQP